MTKGKKKKKVKKNADEKKKIVKVGGLWVDSSSFPSFEEDKEKNSPPCQ
ncbi:MAG: hypothetical protein CSYNP_02433 [Syntrophus sp. SKADARSKE-3]|nr:hypothetical protein [Syntrophus sp. SKADARSKE-3]